MSQLIAVGKGKFAIVDDCDRDLQIYEWRLNKYGYAIRVLCEDGINFRRTLISMHQEIAKRMKLVIPKNYEIDHIDQNKLNNCRDNLRVVTHSQNKQNTDLQKNNTSGVKGVHRNKQTQKYCVYIKIENERIHIGYFDKFEDAVTARKIAEIRYGYNQE